MKTFTLHLQSEAQSTVIENVSSFMAEDASGAFGIKAGHARFITFLNFGLARFQCTNSSWEYLALPGALTYFHNNKLILNTRRYIRGDDYDTISDKLMQELRQEEENLATFKQSLHNLEEEILKRMLDLRHERKSLL